MRLRISKMQSIKKTFNRVHPVIVSFARYSGSQVFATFHGIWKYEPDTREIHFTNKFYDQAKAWGLSEKDALDVYYHGKSFQEGRMVRKYNGYEIGIFYMIAKENARVVITWIWKKERR